MPRGPILPSRYIKLFPLICTSCAIPFPNEFMLKQDKGRGRRVQPIELVQQSMVYKCRLPSPKWRWFLCA